MSAYDEKYLAELVSRAKRRESNAFAELFAATYRQQYRFALGYLEDEYLSKEALHKSYTLAFQHIGDLKDGRLFVPWLSQIVTRICQNFYSKRRAV